jgi:hypothetical protein
MSPDASSFKMMVALLILKCFVGGMMSTPRGKAKRYGQVAALLAILVPTAYPSTDPYPYRWSYGIYAAN